MPAVPGTMLGIRYNDIRNIMPKPIADYYKAQGTWDKIVKYRPYMKSEVVTYKQNGRIIVDKWQEKKYGNGFKWYIVETKRTYEVNKYAKKA